MTSTPRILVLYAHPGHHRSRVNRQLRDAVLPLPNVRVHDLYEAYPDFHIDVAHEQALLVESDLIVFQHPIQWYSMPSLQKEWLDVVFAHGWAYGHEGNALRGKDFLLAATTGGPETSYRGSGYHRRPFSDFLPPYEQTVYLCGMRWNEPLIMHDALRADEAAIAVHAARYAARLASYPQWRENPSADLPAPIAANEYIHNPDAL
jgi:putative NADPH-quinone reductase